MYKEYVKPGSSLLDLAHGRGGDIAKYAYARISSLIAIDIDNDALAEAQFRAKTNTRFQKSVKDVQFLCHDLRTSICAIHPNVDTVVCQFALHFMWQNESTIRTFFQSVTKSLKPTGYFIISILDTTAIPSSGTIDNHPYIFLKTDPSNKIDTKDTKITKDISSTNIIEDNASYQFQFGQRICEAKEYLIPQKELLKYAQEYHLELKQTTKIRECFQEVMEHAYTKPDLMKEDWFTLDLYCGYIFQYNPPAVIVEPDSIVSINHPLPLPTLPPLMMLPSPAPSASSLLSLPSTI